MKALYERAKQKNETVVTIIGNDILDNSQRVITFCHPINADGKFLGAIYWETELSKTFERYIVPSSFQTSSLPFLEIKYPQKDNQVNQQDLVFRVNINDEDFDIL